MSLDYPRSWELARAKPLHKHNPLCSYRTTNGAILCDCEVLTRHREYRSKSMFLAGGVERKNRVIMFQPEFREPIWKGVKRSTIRAIRKESAPERYPVGTMLEMRNWSGVPYRSKPVAFSSGHVVKRSRRLNLGLNDRGDFYVIRESSALNELELDELAKVEGFDSAAALIKWFTLNHKLKPGDHISCRQTEW